jgi:hypothetical protein
VVNVDDEGSRSSKLECFRSDLQEASTDEGQELYGVVRERLAKDSTTYHGRNCLLYYWLGLILLQS